MSVVNGSTQPDARTRVRTLVHLAWPLILGRSSQSVINVCDAAMVAPLGEDALAATTTGALNIFSLAILPMGLIFIVQSFASQYQGKGDLAAARRYGWYALMLSALVGILCIAVSPLIGSALSIMPFEYNVYTLMTDYTVIRLFAMGPLLGTEALGTWYDGLGHTRVHMAVSLGVMVVNVFLNWVLIYGNLGAPALGVEGAALASVLATYLGFAFIALAFGRGWASGRVRGKLGLRWREFVRLLRFGVPNGINWFMEFAAFTVFINAVVADLGTVAHAAIMAVINVNSVSFMPAFGLASAGAILAGQAIGDDRRDQVPTIVRTTLLATMLWQGVVGLTYVAFPEFYMDLFDSSSASASELRELGITLLMISAAWQIFDALGITLGEALRSAGDTSWPMWMRLGLAWLVFTPTAFVVVYVWGGGAVAAILCMVVYLAFLGMALAWRFYLSRAWRDIDLTGDVDPLTPG